MGALFCCEWGARALCLPYRAPLPPAGSCSYGEAPGSGFAGPETARSAVSVGLRPTGLRHHALGIGGRGACGGAAKAEAMPEPSAASAGHYYIMLQVYMYIKKAAAE